MLTVNKLEKIIELEDKLRAEYEGRLDEATAELERCKQEFEAQRQQLQATIEQQLASIQQLSANSAANDQVEQRNRELSNRSDNLQQEVS